MVYLARRFFALYIDGAIIAVLTILTYLVGEILTGLKISEIQSPEQGTLFIIQLVTYFIYFGLSEFLFNRTLGKTMLSLKIAGLEDYTGKKKLIVVLIRSVIRINPVEFISIFLNEEYRTWHDMASKTKVIDVRKNKF